MHQGVSIEGAVDMHAHCGPSVIARRTDGYESAVEAAHAGMDAIVLKEHFLPTIYGIPYIQRLLEADGLEIDVIGSAVLNYCTGGFNPFLVEIAAEHGARVIWAPTIDARNDGEKSGGLGNKLDVDFGSNPEYEGKSGLYALDDHGALKPDVALCVEKIAAHDLVFAIGHLTYVETEALVEYAVDLGHERIIIDHPSYFVTDFDYEQQVQLVELGALLNFPFSAISPRSGWELKDDLYDYIQAIGPDNCIVSSDVGQVGNPSVPDALQMLGEVLLLQGLTEKEFRVMVEENPKKLLY